MGTLVALIAQALPRRRRFDPVTSIESEDYDLVVEESVADEAERLLSEWVLGRRDRRLHRKSRPPSFADEVGGPG